MTPALLTYHINVHISLRLTFPVNIQQNMNKYCLFLTAVVINWDQCGNYYCTWNRCDGSVSMQTAYADLRRERRKYKNIARSDFW
jgi:hypothetical protein